MHIQPRLDASGGRIYGELDAVGLAVFAQATDPGPARATQRGSDRARGGSSARRRADRLIDVLAASLAPDPVGRDGGTRGGDGALLPVAPSVLAVTTLDSLLGRDHTPAEIVAPLAGGRLKLDAATARRLVDEGGAVLRMLVVDDTGRLLGVGRKHRRPPGWLREATLALHATCAEPGCSVPAVHCDLDHITAWAAGGSTDVANLQRLCAGANRTRHKAGWTITTHADGARTWTHARAGLRFRDVPSTRRLALPPPDDPDPP